MKFSKALFSALLPLLAAGCFEHREAPPRLVEATSLEVAATISDTLQRLDLTGAPLDQLPPLLGTMPYLEELILRRTGLNSFEGLDTLTQLRVLDLAEVQLATIPATLFSLGALEHLYLSDNSLTNLPPAIAELSALTYLNLDRNRLQKVPAELGQLSRLRWLRLNHNHLAQLPAEIGSLATLQRIYLRNNLLTTLPDTLEQCQELEDLALSGNRFSEFPLVLTRLPKLRNLDLRDNPLQGELPLAEIAGMQSLRLLTLTGCNIPREREADLRKALPRCLITL